MNRRKLLLGIAASLGAAYGLKAGGLGLGKVARRVGKHPALAWGYGDAHYAMLKAMREMPDANDDPLIHYCHPNEYARIKALGYDMHDCVVLGDLISGAVHG